MSLRALISLSVYRCAKPSDNSTDFFGLLHELIELNLSQIANIESDIKLRADFGTRRFGDAQKSEKVAGISALITFGNIRHNRNCCALELAHKTKIFGEIFLPCDLINEACQNSRFLPCDQILKSLDLA